MSEAAQAILAMTDIHLPHQRGESRCPIRSSTVFHEAPIVNIVSLILTHKDVPYKFHDLEPVMGKPDHLALHPFNRVPILRHGDFTVYETSAIASYVDEAFDGPRLTPQDVATRARMNQWISAVNSYYYPYMIYHVTHERLVFPELGIASDEKVVAHALPKVETRTCRHGARTGARQKLSAWRRALDCGFLHPAEHIRVQPDRGGTGHVSKISGVLPLAGADGEYAGNAKGARRRADACRSNTRANGQIRIGRNTEAKLLAELRSSGAAKLTTRGQRRLPVRRPTVQALRNTRCSRRLRMDEIQRTSHIYPVNDRFCGDRAPEAVMPLKTIGIIAIPNAAGSAFDHGAFDPKSRRVFIAHTARDCIEVIDHDAGKAHRNAAGISRRGRRRRRRRGDPGHQSRRARASPGSTPTP